MVFLQASEHYVAGGRDGYEGLKPESDKSFRSLWTTTVREFSPLLCGELEDSKKNSLRNPRNIQVEMSSWFDRWARSGAQERTGMSWTFSFGIYQHINRSHEIFPGRVKVEKRKVRNRICLSLKCWLDPKGANAYRLHLREAFCPY